MNSPKNRVFAIDRPFRHHGAHSGYKQIASYLGATCLRSGVNGNWLPGRIVRLVPGMHPNWYNPQAFETELAVIWSMLSRGPSTYHYLYGESSYRIGGRANRRLGASHRVVATFHQPPGFFEERRRQFGHLQYLDAVIVVASTQREFFDATVDGAEVRVIPHGVDTRFFHPLGSVKTPNGRYYCLTVGSNYRDFDLLIHVIRNINRSSLREVEFIVVGEASQADRFASLSNVRYMSDISDEELLAQYQAADVLLLPLRDATACNALLEGMACGLPIIATDVGGIREYANDESALLVPAIDAQYMTEALTGLLSDYECRIRIGQNAREAAVQRFDWSAIADQVREVYDRIW